MGTSVQQNDPMLRLQYYRETGQQAEAAKYEQYLKETGQHTQSPPTGHAGKPFVDAQPERETAGDRIAGLISSGYQGMTLGAGNKITAGVRTVLPQVLGGTKGFDFPTALKEQTEVLDQHRRQHPGEALVAEFAGGAPMLALSGGLSGPANAGRLARVGTGILKGAAIGGAAGGAEAIRPDATAGDVGLGAVGGAMTGGALGGVLTGIADSRAGRLFKRDPNAMPKLTLSKNLNIPEPKPIPETVPRGTSGPPPYLGRQGSIEPVLENPSRGVVDAIKQQRPEPSVVDAVKRAPDRQPMYDAFSREAQVADETRGLPDIVKATRNRTESGALQKGATKARLAKDAERMGLPSGPVKPVAPKAPDQPVEEQDIAGLLKRSIKEKGGTPRYAPARNAAGALERDLSKVTDDELENEWHALSEKLGSEEANHSAVQDAGYRGNYEELPRTEKIGRKGQEDLPDADGTTSGERLAADNKTVSDYNRRTVARQAQEKALKRIEAEMESRRKPGGGGFSPIGGAVPFSALALVGAGASVNRNRP